MISTITKTASQNPEGPETNLQLGIRSPDNSLTQLNTTFLQIMKNFYDGERILICHRFGIVLMWLQVIKLPKPMFFYL